MHEDGGTPAAEFAYVLPCRQAVMDQILLVYDKQPVQCHMLLLQLQSVVVRVDFFNGGDRGASDPYAFHRHY